MNDLTKILVMGFGIALIMVIVFCISVLFTMIGWSFFVVPVFSLAPLTFWQAWGFNLLLGSASGGMILASKVKK